MEFQADEFLEAIKACKTDEQAMAAMIKYGLIDDPNKPTPPLESDWFKMYHRAHNTGKSKYLPERFRPKP